MLARCPHCHGPADVGPANRARPFCSERCQQLDLVAWLDEEHVIHEPVARLPDGSEDDGSP
ncbi:MAG: hypothetical protein RLZZ383_1680 [Pseudomonadota bacterium]|jgi:endogenous inhibitor of DNA gyrase (YacG/DUF329 family)